MTTPWPRGDAMRRPASMNEQEKRDRADRAAQLRAQAKFLRDRGQPEAAAILEAEAVVFDD